jgi:vesicle transport protein SEC22
MFKKLAAQRSSAPERLSAEAGAHTFHILNSLGVSFLTLAERSYPKKLAFQYLEELSNEFNRLYEQQQVDSVSRPYAFIKFGKSSLEATSRMFTCVNAPHCKKVMFADTFIQKTKKLYLDTRTQRNLAKLQTDVQEVASIMTKNIADILGQGERMSGVDFNEHPV